MSETPSKRRKRGYEAYDSCADPMDLQPYKVGSWEFQMYYQDFLDGWKQAEKDEAAQLEEDNIFTRCPECGHKL